MGTPQQTGTGIEISGSDVLLATRQGTRSTFIWGMVLVSLGLLAVVAPLISGVDVG